MEVDIGVEGEMFEMDFEDLFEKKGKKKKKGSSEEGASEEEWETESEEEIE